MLTLRKTLDGVSSIFTNKLTPHRGFMWSRPPRIKPSFFLKSFLLLCFATIIAIPPFCRFVSLLSSFLVIYVKILPLFCCFNLSVLLDLSFSQYCVVIVPLFIFGLLSLRLILKSLLRSINKLIHFVKILNR